MSGDFFFEAEGPNPSVRGDFPLFVRSFGFEDFAMSLAFFGLRDESLARLSAVLIDARLLGRKLTGRFALGEGLE